MGNALIDYFNVQSSQLIEYSRCGDSNWSTVPTVLWAVGSAAFAHRIVSSLFKRYMFRRIPLWEIILQHLIFIWIIIYSLHFWAILVKITKLLVQFLYSEREGRVVHEETEGSKLVQQCIIWFCGACPLAFYVHTRPRRTPQPMMIWITTNPWHRREMGPYGYYLNRPLPSIESSTISLREQAKALRKAYSDSRMLVNEQPKKRRMPKSI
ncbi:uncharacterized protein LOC126972872 isoform X1 [Leptidea sinapis]|uniref:uncharacterized protein LOC126972872 isoform X1 n=1 Tax=Leptidea sinapis TaxID=189913 RepID=UPI0021313DDE|nr:uncharacterized protein LOC126972872 isoform X1 [Leptidea sinapis]